MTQRRLRVLERDFHAFVAVRPRTAAEVERQVAALESLRLEYLDVLSHAAEAGDRVLCLVRLAELHLDLGARVRRVPYPAGASHPAQRDFDDVLSQEALPLEAVGRGILTQALVEARAHGLDSRFTRRARLYLALHAGAPMPTAELAWLGRELTDRSWAAPRTLLETGRVGQRAARRRPQT